MYFGIKRAVHLVNQDPDLAALIITGTGDVFAPGGDLGGRRQQGDEPTPDIGHDILPFLTIRDSRAPVVAAVNGICQAGGLLIAMLSDICVASDRATFRVPELLRGIPDATYAAVLPAHVGMAVARDLLLTGRRFDAAEAQRIGRDLARRARTTGYARPRSRWSARSCRPLPTARTHTKRMLNERYGLIDYQTMFWALDESPEPREGMLAFMEKRAPSWVPEQFGGKEGRRPPDRSGCTGAAGPTARRGRRQDVTARRQKSVDAVDLGAASARRPATGSPRACRGWRARRGRHRARARRCPARRTARAAARPGARWRSGARRPGPPSALPPFHSTARVVAAMSPSAWASTPSTQRRTWPSGVGSLAIWWAR